MKTFYSPPSSRISPSTSVPLRGSLPQRMHARPSASRLARTSLLLCASLAGCASYTPLPLDTRAQPAVSVSELLHRERQSQRAAPSAPYSVDDAISFALQYNPDLIAARRQRGIAQAQILEAGILPNPSLSGSYGFLLGGPGTIDAISGGLTQDLKSILTLRYRKHSALEQSHQIDAALLWQEWQLVARVRQLAADVTDGEERSRLLGSMAERLQDLSRRNSDALARGDATLTTVAPDLAAEAAAKQLASDAERQLATARRDLNVLMGLAPAADFPLRTPDAAPPIDLAGVNRSLDSLAERRPDLLALQFAYRSQEQRVRGAIAAQFPLLTLGVSGGHDNSDVRFVGPQGSVELPIFNRNQGTIALERATRQQLHDEFTARVQAARSEVQSLLADQALITEQLARKQIEMQALQRTADAATHAREAHDLDERTYLDAFGARDAKTLEIFALRRSLLQQQISIEALIGVGMPPINVPSGNRPT